MKLDDHFLYDEYSDTCLIWKELNNPHSAHHSFKQAGNVTTWDNKRYFRVRVNDVMFNICDIIWEHFNGTFDKLNKKISLIDLSKKPTIDNLKCIFKSKKLENPPKPRNTELSSENRKLKESDDKFNERSILASSKGYTYLGRLIEDDRIPKENLCDYGSYKNNSCGHVLKTSHSTFRKLKTDFCRQCMEEEYKNLASSLGMEFINFNKPIKNGTTYIKVKLPCGHNKNIQTGNLRNGNYKCQECWFDSFKATLSEFDITLIDSHSSRKYNVILPCGCKVVRDISNLMVGSWSCTKHKMSTLDFKSYIYLLNISYEGNSWLKLGYSYSPEIRSSSLSELPLNIEIIKSFMFNTGREALKIEKLIHSKFKSSAIPKSKLKDLMVSGFTECYPKSMESLLLSEVEKEIASKYGG